MSKCTLRQVVGGRPLELHEELDGVAGQVFLVRPADDALGVYLGHVARTAGGWMWAPAAPTAAQRSWSTPCTDLENALALLLAHEERGKAAGVVRGGSALVALADEVARLVKVDAWHRRRGFRIGTGIEPVMQGVHLMEEVVELQAEVVRNRVAGVCNRDDLLREAAHATAVLLHLFLRLGLGLEEVAGVGLEELARQFTTDPARVFPARATTTRSGREERPAVPAGGGGG
jgi:hypothetical protein